MALTTTESYRHASAGRTNLPTSETEPAMPDEDKAPRSFSPSVRERDDGPVLAWAREDDPARPVSAAVNGAPSPVNGAPSPVNGRHLSYPLYVREKIHPGAFVDSRKRTPDTATRTLFDDFNGLPRDAAYEWYCHKGNWQNRIIHGESARVMASLADRENLTGRVQMVYFDPPYGIGFKSNFQTSTRNRETAASRKGLPNDPRSIRAFRDTYQRGIHSYLDQILEKLVLCRDLLTGSGSVFVQIGDENVCNVSKVLDEAFGANNRVAIIPFVTSGSSSSKTLPSVADFLLWYAKDKHQVKYRQLYEPLSRAEKINHMAWGVMLELADGTTRKITPEERADLAELPKGSRLYQRMPLASQGTSTTGRSEPYHWKAKNRTIGCPAGSHWTVSMEGLDRLSALGRLDMAKAGSVLRWKQYEDEIPGRKINNVWHQRMSSSDKRYVVQTADRVIERCVLMSTDPGDLVFDPTCGGATTALAAEKWGRRWITCDTSPISVAIARQRIATATFKYWTLADSPEGTEAELSFTGDARNRPGSCSGSSKGAAGTAVGSFGRGIIAAPAGEHGHDPAKGFVYERVPYASPAVLAYGLDPEPTMLVDRPHVTRRKVRVSSPFTVESSSPWRYTPIHDDSVVMTGTEKEFTETVTEALLRSPVRADGVAGDIRIVGIGPWPGERMISHLATYTVGGSSTERQAGLLIAAEDVTVTAAMQRAAALDAATSISGTDLVIVVGFAFEPDTSVSKVGRVEIARVQMHRDLIIRDLSDDASHQAFVMLGQPDIAVHDEPGGRVSVELLGYDTYDPSTGQVESSDAESGVACWMVDTDYDGFSFFARRVHFPGAGRDKQMKRLYKQLGRTLDLVSWRRSLSLRSAPFDKPGGVRGTPGRVAVKIITSTGTEMSVAAEIV